MIPLRKIGKIVIILSFIASLNPYLLIFTTPIFIIGAILIWVNQTKLLSNLLWTLLPIILWYPFFMLFIYLSGVIGTATAQKLDFILPVGFEGQVMIIENMPCGQQKKIISGREQLFIPQNGILLYQGELKNGYVNHKYYRLKSNGQIVELPERANYMYFESEKNKPNSKIVGVWPIGAGKKSASPPNISNMYRFMNLLVASKDSSEKYYEFQYMEKFKNLTDSLVSNCKVNHILK